MSVDGREISKENLEKLLKDDVRIQNYVDSAFKEIFFQVAPDEKPEYNGTQLINSKVIASYLRQLLRNDLEYAPFKMVGMEKRVQEMMDVETDAGKIRLALGGTIDRLDEKEGVLRIVDYKTGGSPKTLASMDALFEPSKDRPNYIFQTFLYAAIECAAQQLQVAPSLLYIHWASSDKYSPVIEMGEPHKSKVSVMNFSLLEKDFRARLKTLVEEIFGMSEPFTQTEFDNRCEYCEFKKLCRR